MAFITAPVVIDKTINIDKRRKNVCRCVPHATVEHTGKATIRYMTAGIYLLAATGALQWTKLPTVNAETVFEDRQRVEIAEFPSHSNESQSDQGGLPSYTTTEDESSPTDVLMEPSTEYSSAPTATSEKTNTFQNYRRALALSAGAVATVVYVRRRSRASNSNGSIGGVLRNKKESGTGRVVDASRFERASFVPEAPVEAQPQTQFTEDIRNAFSHSRAEWGSSSDNDSNFTNREARFENSVQPSTDVSDVKNSNNDDSDGRTSVRDPESSVYSFSFRTSRRKRAQEPPHSDLRNKQDKIDDSEREVDGTAFQHMRAEFTADDKVNDINIGRAETESVRDQGTWAATSVSDKGNPLNVSDKWGHLQTDEALETNGNALRGPMSGAELVRRAISAPLWAVREVIVPTWEILSVGWTDTRAIIVDMLEGRKSPFIVTAAPKSMDAPNYREGGSSRRDEARGRNASDTHSPLYDEAAYDEDRLSEEERQVLALQRAAKEVSGTMQRSVQKLIRFFW